MAPKTKLSRSIRKVTSGCPNTSKLAELAFREAPASQASATMGSASM
jgi:hypothetical protein